MSQKQSKAKKHPAVESVKKAMTTRYIIVGVGLAICVALLALGFIFKPGTKAVEAQVFTGKTAEDTYVKSDVTLIYPMFSQDKLDDKGNVDYEMYHILAVDTDRNLFIISAPKSFYESILKPLESNSVQNITDESLEILDEDLKVTVYGYTREMSNNLTDQLEKYMPGYQNSLLKYSLETVDGQLEAASFNYFFIAAASLGIITLIILITAVSLTAKYSATKKKYENKNSK